MGPVPKDKKKTIEFVIYEIALLTTIVGSLVKLFEYVNWQNTCRNLFFYNIWDLISGKLIIIVMRKPWPTHALYKFVSEYPYLDIVVNA